VQSYNVPVRDVAALLGVRFVGTDQAVTGLSPLSDAARGDLSFVTDRAKYSLQLENALRAGAVVLVAEGAAVSETLDGTVIAVARPRAAFARAVSELFAERPPSGISQNAVIDPSATIHPTAHIGDFTVIGRGVVIGEGSELRNHVVIGPNVQIGSRALIKSHAVIGEEGFGIDVDDDGNNLRLPHVGSVVIGEDVEIGCFTTICSGTIVPSVIGHHSKIDDHVHVAHNCTIGANVIITACAEISGSVTIGDRAWIGPNASVIQGVTIGEHALVGIAAVVLKSVGPDEVHFGSPARKIRLREPDE
jgi:UDP-3-O-[3-hydroxymyristoyl] glucosamine N-acyltransferase